MPDHEPARAYIHAMIGHRTRISDAERDLLQQLLNTPAVRARFPSLTHEELCAIADSLVEPALATPRRKGVARRPSSSRQDASSTPRPQVVRGRKGGA
jgi:hypothetical protein